MLVWLRDVSDREEELERTNDLLALAREGEPVDSVESVRLEALARGAWGNVETDDAELRVESDLTFEADRGRVYQLFENLFRNSVEHGGEDVTVTVGPLYDGFYVEDDGPGIPYSERDRVFEAGYSTREEGTGFGLRIVERIATAHGWHISATEGESGGARFEVTGVDPE